MSTRGARARAEPAFQTATPAVAPSAAAVAAFASTWTRARGGAGAARPLGEPRLATSRSTPCFPEQYYDDAGYNGDAAAAAAAAATLAALAPLRRLSSASGAAIVPPLALQRARIGTAPPRLVFPADGADDDDDDDDIGFFDVALSTSRETLPGARPVPPSPPSWASLSPLAGSVGESGASSASTSPVFFITARDIAAAASGSVTMRASDSAIAGGGSGSSGASGASSPSTSAPTSPHAGASARSLSRSKSMSPTTPPPSPITTSPRDGGDVPPWMLDYMRAHADRLLFFAQHGGTRLGVVRASIGKRALKSALRRREEPALSINFIDDRHIQDVVRACAHDDMATAYTLTAMLEDMMCGYDPASQAVVVLLVERGSSAAAAVPPLFYTPIICAV